MFQAVPYSGPLFSPEPPENRYSLPGFGLPLDFHPMSKNYYGVSSRSLLPTALDGHDMEKGFINQPLLSIREMTMMRLMNEFTDDPSWVDKVFDDTFVSSWKGKVASHERDVSPQMIDWMVDELRFKAKIWKYSTNIQAVNVFNGDVVKSDTPVFMELCKELDWALDPLEKGTRNVKEFVFGSDLHERDLVHPSYFPLVYGRSKILRDRVINRDEALANMGQGEVIEVPTGPLGERTRKEGQTWRVASRDDIQIAPYSSSYQWLPFDVQFREDGSPYIASYINNVHPTHHSDVYTAMEKILDKTIPMWNLSLTPVKDILHSRSRIELHQVAYEQVPEDIIRQEPTQNSNETQSEFEERLQEWRMKTFNVIQPNPAKFAPVVVPPEIMDHLPPEERNKHRVESVMDLRKDYGSKRPLQVIARVLDIEVTPDKPVFETSWHVDGQMNEHLCASAFLFFADPDSPATQNITEPRVAFRQASDTEPLHDVSYKAGDSVWLEQIFGLSNNMPAVQEIGSITGRPGRMITWPNVLQHRMLPMRLKDRNQANGIGRCKILNLLLVDPNIRIISTANVPPQRIDWRDPAADSVAGAEGGLGLEGLSLDEQNKRLKREGGFPFTIAEARDFLQKAKEERDAFTHYQDVAFHAGHVNV